MGVLQQRLLETLEALDSGPITKAFEKVIDQQRHSTPETRLVGEDIRDAEKVMERVSVTLGCARDELTAIVGKLAVHEYENRPREATQCRS